MTTLFTNGLILAVDETMTVHEKGWVLVEDDRVTQVGAGAPPQLADAEIIDLSGDILMPGMVNPHCHMPMTLFRGLGEDVDDRLFRYVLPIEREFV